MAFRPATETRHQVVPKFQAETKGGGAALPSARGDAFPTRCAPLTQQRPWPRSGDDDGGSIGRQP